VSGTAGALALTFIEMTTAAKRHRLKTPIIEHCWLVVGRRQSSFWLGRRVQPTTGTVVTVEFDPYWVIEREENRGDVIGFYHTHPGGRPGPSSRDVHTMRAWVDSLGKPLLCLIEASEEVGCFLFDDFEDGIEIDCERFPRGAIVAYETY